ncbi:MAG: hypothetical protein KF767_19045 [Bdellovibrionaceae bacterium]|nr:hypothetical protein [Pseudobdellovibrionaceae bacterium]
MEMRTWSKPGIGGLIAVLLLSAAYVRAESRQFTMPHERVATPHLNMPHQIVGDERGDVLKSAKYDKRNGVMVIEIESDNFCNLRQGALLHERSGRATFGPHIYRLEFGIKTMMGCGGRGVATIKVPMTEKQATGRILIHLPDDKKVITAESIDFIKRRQSEDFNAVPRVGSSTAPESAGGRN